MKELRVKQRFQAIEYRPSAARNTQKNHSENPKVVGAISELRNLYEEGVVQYTTLRDTQSLNKTEHTILRRIISSSYHPARITLRQPSLHGCLSCFDTLPYASPEILDTHETLSLHTRYVCPGCFKIARTQSALTRHLHRSRICALQLETFLGAESWDICIKSGDGDGDGTQEDYEKLGLTSRVRGNLAALTKVFALTAHEAVEMAARKKAKKEPKEFLVHILRQQIVSFQFDFWDL